jgi:hypothetical protein
MDEVWLKLKIQNGCLSMKTMYICICSGFYKHGRILSKFGMQVSIGYVIMENENRVKNPKIPPKINAVVGRPSNLIMKMLTYFES